MNSEHTVNRMLMSRTQREKHTKNAPNENQKEAKKNIRSANRAPRSICAHGGEECIVHTLFGR